MTSVQRTISPIDGSVYLERRFSSAAEIDSTLDRAQKAQKQWALTPLEERAAVCRRFADYLLDRQDDIALEITWQMGRPLGQAGGEVKGCAFRANTMIDLAAEGLADIAPAPIPGIRRYIRRVPLGVVYVIAPWNYPLLTAVNTVVPAIMAGNSVVLKHAPQTPLCGERFAEAFRESGLPDGVFQTLIVENADAERIVTDPRVAHVAFTGSVKTGHRVQRAASERFISVGLELGGKDPAYVRADADVAFAAENIVDGAFFNSGQSCCGIERIYVHKDQYDDFVSKALELTSSYVLGNPLMAGVNLGPVISSSAASCIRDQVDEAVAAGAVSLLPASAYEAHRPDSAYVSPRLLIGVNHSMRVMTEETFGPVVGIMRVSSDEEAVQMMNDSAFGLTASIWTADVEAAERLAGAVDAGTVFANRCDYLDPSLPWSGVKDSGRGATLSVLGYEHLTRPKAYHLRNVS